jgi:3-deoxy-manno-octulosonate cytidylyltransferase (CMP-KDO synthetase)
MKTVGIVPARMAASRFPGKPLYSICGMPMVEHVYRRAAKYEKWNGLYLATCDREIKDVGDAKNMPAIMTSDRHTRALDRVAEAAEKCGQDLGDNDVVVCVQGDEPMMHPDMVSTCILPLERDLSVYCTVLGMEIVDEQMWRNPDTVKIIHNIEGDVVYTSRAPVPYCKSFPPKNYTPRRIYGIFAFRWNFLKTFTDTPQSPLEIVESCDSNRIFDTGYRQRVAPYPYRPSFSVDDPSDVKLVEAHILKDPLWGTY